MIEIEGPDGVIYEFPEGMPEAEMLAAMEQVYAAPQAQNSVAGVAGQLGAGSQEGIAQMLGMPVDAVAGAMSGLGELTGLWGPIENPIGGSASIGALLEPFRAGIAEPQTDMERAARRVGEEVGAGVVGMPIALGSAVGRAAPAAVAAVEGASSLGSGLGAAGAQYLAPDSTIAEIAGMLAGGVPAAMVASRALGVGGVDAARTGGTMESQRQRAADAYEVVRADQGLYSPDPLIAAVEDIASSERLNRRLQPVSDNLRKAVTEDLGVARGGMGPSRPVRVEDLENMRRVIGGSVSPVTTSPADQRIAGMMRDELTGYIDNLNTPASEALREGRDATRRYKAADMVAQATEKAERRAASTGSGGNEINAIRQNIRGLLDNPNKARSFTQSERAAMEEIVRGSTDQNLMRRLSRFAPSSGGLASMLGIGGALASPAVAMPIVGLTEGAKMLGERSTQRSIDALVRSLLGERVTSASRGGADEIAAALLGLRATEQGSN